MAGGPIPTGGGAAGGGSGDIEGVTAGAGLTGGGASGAVTLDVGAGTGIIVNANDVAIDPTVVGLAATQTIAGAGLTGGGTHASDRTINVIANADGSIVVNANDIQVGVINATQHGVLAGGTTHADVIAAGASGFMTGADKTKLNGIGTGATVATVTAAAAATISMAGTAADPTVAVNLAGAFAWTTAHSWTLSDAATTSVSTTATYNHQTGGAAGIGYGHRMLWQGEDASGNADDMAAVDVKWSDATSASEDTTYDILLRTAGGALASAMTLTSIGNVTVTGSFLAGGFGIFKGTGGSATLQTTSAGTAGLAPFGTENFGARSVTTSGVLPQIYCTPNNCTGTTAGGEAPMMKVSPYTRTWANGALALQRFNYWGAPTYAFASSSATNDVTDVYNGFFDDPVAGANVDSTVNAWSFGTQGAVNFGKFIQLTEQTAPVAGATNTLRLYAEDTGGGKTRLVVLFPTGAAQVLATEA